MDLACWKALLPLLESLPTSPPPGALHQPDGHLRLVGSLDAGEDQAGPGKAMLYI